MLERVLGVVLPSCHHSSCIPRALPNSLNIPLFLDFFRAPSDTPGFHRVLLMKHEFGIGAGQVLKVSLSSGARQLLCSWRSFCWLIVLP